MQQIKTLLDAVKYFSEEKVCVEFVANLRWGCKEDICCPKCGSLNVKEMTTRQLWFCKEKECKKQFSVKVGSCFEKSPLPLSKWLPAMWFICNAKNGISSCELARALGVQQRTAWFMLHRLRDALRTKTFKKLSGTVEIDETYVGGKEYFKHNSQIPSSLRNRGTKGKTPVMGMIERGGEVRAQVVENVRRNTLEPKVIAHVEPSATVYTDALSSYYKLGEHFNNHASVDHGIGQYVNGQIHTNSIENFWCLFKRSIKGTYTQIAPFHIDRYLDEQVWRFNARKLNDYGRFVIGLKRIFGCRLTYAELTGKLAV